VTGQIVQEPRPVAGEPQQVQHPQRDIEADIDPQESPRQPADVLLHRPDRDDPGRHDQGEVAGEQVGQTAHRQAPPGPRPTLRRLPHADILARRPDQSTHRHRTEVRVVKECPAEPARTSGQVIVQALTCGFMVGRDGIEPPTLRFQSLDPACSSRQRK